MRPLPVGPTPNGDIHHGPLHGEIPGKNGSPPHFPASLFRLTFPPHFSSSLPHTRLSGGYRHALPLPPEGAGEERRRRGRGRGLREEFCMTETGVKDRGEGLLVEA